MENKVPVQSVFRKLEHVGVVVRDMEKAIEYLSSLGIGPFEIAGGAPWIEVPFEGELHGKPASWTMKISKTTMGGIDLELLQPVEGESLLQEFLDSNGEGLHHLGFTVDNLESEISKLAEHGVKVLTSGRGAKGASFAYLDTGIMGGILTEFKQIG